MSALVKCRLCNKNCVTDKSLLICISKWVSCNEDYQFCSKECKDLFQKTKCCWFCNYIEDLFHVPELECMLCTSKAGSRKYSCLEKYDLRKKNNLDFYWYSDSDYDELCKTYHERIMNLSELLSDALKRIESLEEEVSELRDLSMKDLKND